MVNSKRLVCGHLLRTPMQKGELLCNFIEITLAWVFSFKFSAYFQNTFSQEHLWTAASDILVRHGPQTVVYLDKWCIQNQVSKRSIFMIKNRFLNSINIGSPATFSSILYANVFFGYFKNLDPGPGSGPWTWTLNPDPEKPGP